LLRERSAYSATVCGGYAADTLALIQCRYFKWYLVDLPHTVESSPEFLADINDDAADIDVQEPNQDKMSKEEYKTTMDQLAEHQRFTKQ